MLESDDTGPVDVRDRARARSVAKALEGPSVVRVLAPGGQLGRFTLGRVLGRGGTATVFAAYDGEAGREVALKVLRDAGAWQSGAASRRAFLAEARALAKLRHPGIVRVYDAGIVDGHAVLTMELVEGQTFEAWVDDTPRDEAEVCTVVAAVCDALAAAHAIDIVHRDVKPSNVVVGVSGGIKLLDFGLARAVEGRVATASSMVVGTLGFVAPERLRGASGDAAADQYGAGALLCFGLGLTLPSDVGGAASMDLTGRPAPLAALVGRAMHPEPSQRFDGVGGLATALRRHAGGSKRRAWPWLAAAAVVALVLSLAWAFGELDA